MRTLALAAMLCGALMGPAWAGQPIVAMYGDSLTAGLTGSSAAGYRVTTKNEPSLLQNALTAIVENHGVSGITCFDLLNGGSGIARNWWGEMAASKAVIVTIGVGMNDAFHSDEEWFKSCLTSLVTVAQGYGKTVVIETPNPLGPSFTQYWRDRLQTFAVDARGVALSSNALVIDQYSYDQDFAGWESHLSDDIHPDDALYAYKAMIALCVLGPLVGILMP